MAVAKKTAKPAAKKPAARKPPAKPAVKAAVKSIAKTAPAPKKRNGNVTFLKMPRPHFGSHIAHGGEKLAPALQALIDRADIAQALATLARGLDRCDETLLRSALHSDATLDFGPGVFQGAAGDYVHWVLSVLHGVKSSHHLLAQTRVELSGDSAGAETYFHIHFRVEKPVGREDVFMGGRYLDRMERRPGGPAGVWKIAHRKQIIDWVRTEAVSDIFYHQNPDALWSARSKIDPSTQMAQFPGSQPGGKLPAFLGRRYENKSMRF